MDLGLSAEERLLAEAPDRLVADYAQPPADAGPFHASPSLEAALVDAGYLDVVEALGGVAGVLVVEAVARTRFAVEIAASVLIAPRLGRPSQRPLAVAEAGQAGTVRFLATGGGLLLVGDGEVSRVERMDKVAEVSTPMAYPYGRPIAPAAGAAALDVAADDVRLWMRIGLCAEAVGAMRAALDLTVRYVAERRQFGRAIGAFQAVQHRLAECACLVDGARLLTLKAAHSGADADAGLAASFTLSALAPLVAGTNQLHGAIGLTMEYPLHYWSYRMRALQGELGGAAAQAALASRLLWPDADRRFGS